jgi:hypothetical protein
MFWEERSDIAVLDCDSIMQVCLIQASYYEWFGEKQEITPFFSTTALTFC